MQRSNDSPDEIRKRIVATKNAMDRAYLQLGRDLYLVFHRRMFIGWGFDSFKDYVEEEIGEDLKRCERVMRIWAHLVKGCSLRPSVLKGLSYTNALQLLPVTDRSNAAARIAMAKKLSWRDLRTKIKVWKSPSADDVADLPRDEDGDEDGDGDGDNDEPTEPEPEPEPADDDRETMTFRLYPGQAKVVDAAIAEAQRAKDCGMAPNEALANMATEFLASRMAKEDEPVTRLSYILGVLERVYGGKIIWIPTDEAAGLLIKTMEDHPDLFNDPNEASPDDV